MPIATAIEPRSPERLVDPQFIHRWSSRALSGETITEEELGSLFEAAKWAPSSFNNQPWRFIYGRRDSVDWSTFLDLLVENNKVWAQRAAVLIVIVSKQNFDNGKPSRTHSFDAGAAWMSLALQGSMMGLVVHAMEGFDYERARKDLAIPSGYTVEAMVAVGRRGRVEDLPETLQVREFPNSRKRQAEIVFEGGFR